MQRRGLVLPALAAMLLALRPVAAEAEPVRLVTPVVYGTHLPGLGTPAAKLAKQLERRSAGTVTLDLKEPGGETKPHEILDKVSDGAVDAGFATASFWAAKLPAGALFSGFPFGPEGSEYFAWFEKGNGRTLYQEMYDHAGLNVHVMPCAFGGAETGGWFAKEIKDAADLEGLRMRIFGLGGSVMSRAGATTMLVPGSGLAGAFEAKKIDAAELYTPAVDALQPLKDKIKLVYMPGWQKPETVLEFIVNKDRWESLSEEQQSLIGETCRALLKETLEDSARLQAEALARMREKDGIKIKQWPQDVLSSLRAAWEELASEEGGRDYFFRMVLDDIAKFRATPQQHSAPKPAAADASP